MLQSRARAIERARSSAANSSGSDVGRSPLRGILKKNASRRPSDIEDPHDASQQSSSLPSTSSPNRSRSREEPDGQSFQSPQQDAFRESGPVRDHDSYSDSDRPSRPSFSNLRGTGFARLPRVDESDWLDSILLAFNRLGYFRSGSLWFKVCILILALGSLIGILLLLGANVHFLVLQTREVKSTGEASSSLRTLWVLLNRTVDKETPVKVLLGELSGSVDESTSEPPTPIPPTKRLDISRYEIDDFSEFLLGHDPLTRTCVLFLSVKPRVRVVRVILHSGPVPLVGNAEQEVFTKLCDPSRTYKCLEV